MGHCSVATRAYYSFVSSRERARKMLDPEPGIDSLLSACSSGKLEDWRIVTSFCVDAERRKPLGGAPLDLDLAPSGIVRFITRVISKNILVAQLRAACGKVDKKNCSSLEICLGARCAGHPTNVHHPRRTRMGRDWPVMPVYSDTISPARMGHYRDYVGSLPPILLVAYCSF